MRDGQLHSGWNPTLDIPSALALAPRQYVGDSHVLISVVDSSPKVAELASLLPLLDRLEASYRTLGDGVVIDGDVLVKLINDHGFFNGFDELWLFGKSPEVGKPEAIPLTSDVRLETEPPSVLVDWMRENDGVAGLGDGIGLNFVTFRPALAQLWTEK
jgi:hypothetical protein